MTLEDLKDFIFWDIKVYGCPSTPEQIEYFIKYMYEKLYKLKFIITDEHQKILDEVYQNNIENNIDLNGGFDFYRYLVENNPKDEQALRLLIENYEIPKNGVSKKKEPTISKKDADYFRDKYKELKDVEIEQETPVLGIEQATKLFREKYKVPIKENTTNTTDSKPTEVSGTNDMGNAKMENKNNAELSDYQLIRSQFNIHEGKFGTKITDSFVEHITELIVKTIQKVKGTDKKKLTDEITKETLLHPYTIEDFEKNIVGEYSKKAEELKKTVQLLGGILFISVPGNGKTTICIELAKYLKGNDADPILINFNPTTSNSDTVGGIRIGNDGWDFVLGTVAKVCKEAVNNPDTVYPIILDEINRADTDTAFGELLTAMSKRNVPVITNFGKQLIVPENVYFLMTMNTYDTNVNTLSEALYSRVSIEDIDELNLTKEDVKGFTKDDKIIATAGHLITALDDINKILGEDKIHGKANCIGNRILFANYNDFESSRLVFEKTLMNLCKRKINNLKDITIEEAEKKCKEIISNSMELIRDTWQTK